MKRPLVLFTVFLCLGIITSYLTNNTFTLLMLAVVFLACIFGLCKCTGRAYLFIGIIIFYSIGALEYICVDNMNSARFGDFYGKDAVIKGYIDSEPDLKEYNIVYTIKTDGILCDGKWTRIHGRTVLTVPKNKKYTLFGYGKRINVSGQLDLPKGRRNPGGFDYREYMARSGITAVIYASEDKIKAEIGYNINIVVDAGLKIRDKIVSVIQRSLPKEQSSLLNAMMIGYTEDLSDEAKGCFSDAGLSHIMSVSGMNVAFIVFPLAFIFKKLRFRQRLSNALIISAAVFFLFITGFSPSVLRAVIMACIILSGEILRRESDVYTSLAFAAIVLLILNPYTLFDVGFQLSFSATFSIVLLYKKIKAFLSIKYLPDAIVKLIAVNIAAQIGTVPVTMLYFNKISIVSIISNLLVIPLVECVTILGFIMALIGQASILLSQYLGYINCTLLTFILYVSEISSKLPFAVLKVPTPGIPVLISYYLMIAIIYLRKSIKANKYLKAAVLASFVVSVLAGGIYILTPKGLEVVFLDVGEGDCALIKTYSGKTILVDGGGSINDKESNIGETVVVPFLMDYNSLTLDAVVATHPHNDHIGGLMAVFKELKVKRLFLPQSEDNGFNELKQIANTKGTSINYCTSKDKIRIDDRTYIEVLYPLDNIKETKNSLNDSSLVLKLVYGSTSIIFAGDIDNVAEKAIIQNNGRLDADVLKAVHHGAKLSSCMEFIDAIKPAAAVISVGKNTFGHPSKEVIERFQERKIRVFRTDTDGAVILKSDGNKIKIYKTIENNKLFR